jgi:hypothetical protein
MMANQHIGSHVVLVKPGRRETETTLIEADGVSAMINEDGTISIELYCDDKRAKRVLIRICAEDCRSQSHVFKRWSGL